MICCAMTGAVAKQVKVVTNEGVVYVGTLKQFKAFEKVVLIIQGKEYSIPYNNVEAINEVAADTPEQVPAGQAPSEQTPSEAVKEEPVKEEPVKARSRKAKSRKAKSRKEEQPEVDEQPKVVEEPKVVEQPKVVEEPKVVEQPKVVEEPVVVEQPKVLESPKALLEEPKVNPEPKANPEPKVNPEPKAKPEPKVKPEPNPTSKLTGYTGFVLEKGNNVYLDCTSDPKNDEYDNAAVDVLKRQLRRDGFWNVVADKKDAHLTIICKVDLNKKTSIGIGSPVTGKEEILGDTDQPENVNDYRRIVWEMYNKHVLTLQRKIENEKVPKQMRKDFTK